MSATLDQVRASVNLPPYLRIEARKALHANCKEREWYKLCLGNIELAKVNCWSEIGEQAEWELLHGERGGPVDAPGFATPGEAIDWFYRMWILCE